MPTLRSEVSINVVQRGLQVNYAHAFKKFLVDNIDLGNYVFTFGIKHPKRKLINCYISG